MSAQPDFDTMTDAELAGYQYAPDGRSVRGRLDRADLAAPAHVDVEFLHAYAVWCGRSRPRRNALTGPSPTSRGCHCSASSYS